MKKFNLKRPSLWYCPNFNTMRILYPNGYVEMLSDDGYATWTESIFSSNTSRKALIILREIGEFVSYL